MKKVAVVVSLGSAALIVGCNKGEDSPKGGAPAPSASSSSSTTAPSGSTTKAGDHNRLPIGERTMGGLKLVATMDEPVKPGGEGAFDVVITGGKPKAVRFWVGTESAEGSVRAKAEEETTDNWHTHAEVPNPLPPGSKFWVEVEPPAGEKFTTSFDLRVQ
jgi:hypothetical protein